MFRNSTIEKNIVNKYNKRINKILRYLENNFFEI